MLPRNLQRWMAISLLLLMVSPLFVAYVTNISGIAWWIYAWLGVFLLFAKMKKSDLATRGVTLIALTCYVVFAGQYLLTAEADKPVIGMLANIMLLIAGGVGGNFISAHFLKK